MKYLILYTRNTWLQLLKKNEGQANLYRLCMEEGPVESSICVPEQAALFNTYQASGQTKVKQF